MSEPVYRLYLNNWKEAGWRLSEEERKEVSDKAAESYERVGGERIVDCDSSWSSEQWLGWGVQKFPNIEALQQHHRDMMEIEWYRYANSISILGTEWPDE